jgi:hypothetical protein
MGELIDNPSTHQHLNGNLDRDPERRIHQAAPMETEMIEVWSCCGAG